MTQSQRTNLLKMVEAWLDSANRPDSPDHQLILTREGVKLSNVNKEPYSVGISIRSSVNVVMLEMEINKIVTPNSGLVVATPAAPPAEAAPNNPT